MQTLLGKLLLSNFSSSTKRAALIYINTIRKPVRIAAPTRNFLSASASFRYCEARQADESCSNGRYTRPSRHTTSLEPKRDSDAWKN